MIIPTPPTLLLNAVTGIAGLALSPITKAVAGLYGIATDINDHLNRHIEDMKSSNNATVSRTGRVLEMAKFGFGIGYLSSVTIIAVGQFLLGNTLAAVTTVATAATLSNPIAMTCAAVGAIIYGWGALDDQEKNDILARLANGLEIGVELIKSVIAFVIATAKEVLDSKTLKDLKSFIGAKAALFGRSLSDVTHLTSDMLGDAASSVKKHAQVAIVETGRFAGETTDKVGAAFSGLAKAAGDAIEATGGAAKRAVETGKDKLKR
jgi:hypothetical protein